MCMFLNMHSSHNCRNKFVFWDVHVFKHAQPPEFQQHGCFCKICMFLNMHNPTRSVFLRNVHVFKHAQLPHYSNMGVIVKCVCFQTCTIPQQVYFCEMCMFLNMHNSHITAKGCFCELCMFLNTHNPTCMRLVQGVTWPTLLIRPLVQGFRHTTQWWVSPPSEGHPLESISCKNRGL